MKSQRPYLLRALYDWIVDSDETPYVLVDASIADVVVPTEFVEDGQIVLNMGPNAVRDLVLENDFVMFNSRFAGRAFEIILPMASIKAIYCKDSGEGMVFPEEDITPDAVSDGADISSATEPAQTSAKDPQKDSWAHSAKVSGFQSETKAAVTGAVPSTKEGTKEGTKASIEESAKKTVVDTAKETVKDKTDEDKKGAKSDSDGPPTLRLV